MARNPIAYHYTIILLPLKILAYKTVLRNKNILTTYMYLIWLNYPNMLMIKNYKYT